MARRSERVGEAIRRSISGILHTELRDPRMQGFITVTRVEVTADLRFARIHYSVLGDEKKKKSIAIGLRCAKSFIRKRIANELKLRYAPDIAFKYDERAEHSERIDRVLDKIHKEEGHENDKKNSQ